MELTFHILCFVIGYIVRSIIDRQTIDDTPNKCYNIEIIQENGQFYFYEMETDKFLFQTKTHDEGVEKALDLIEEGQVLVFS